MKAGLCRRRNCRPRSPRGRARAAARRDSRGRGYSEREDGGDSQRHRSISPCGPAGHPHKALLKVTTYRRSPPARPSRTPSMSAFPTSSTARTRSRAGVELDPKAARATVLHRWSVESGKEPGGEPWALDSYPPASAIVLPSAEEMRTRTASWRSPWRNLTLRLRGFSPFFSK